MRAEAHVDAGICGYSAVVSAEAQDPLGMAALTLDTDCPYMARLGKSFDVEIIDMVQGGRGSETFQKLSAAVPALHFPCPIVNGIFQAVRIAAGLSLPREIRIAFTKEKT
jgi:hypothetical protein